MFQNGRQQNIEIIKLQLELLEFQQFSHGGQKNSVQNHVQFHPQGLFKTIYAREFVFWYLINFIFVEKTKKYQLCMVDTRLIITLAIQAVPPTTQHSP